MITRSQFDALSAANFDYAVSIYIPTYRVGQEQEDRLRLKNALKQAEHKLTDRHGLTEPQAEDFLAKGYDLVEQPDFWKEQSDGLAVFIADDRFEYFSCPVDFEPLVYLSQQFYLRPLIPALGGETEYYFLALSRGAVKLFAASEYTVAPVDVSGLVPQNMEAALLLDTAENNLSRAGGAEGQRGSNSPVYFSRGSEPGTDVEDVKTYLDRVDKGISDYLCDSNAPLVVGGVDELIPIYHEANTYSHLYKESHVSGNLENDALPMLHEKSWAVIAPHFRAQAERDMKLYGDNLAAGEAGSDLETIVPAAINGRIAALWVDRKATAYGSYDAQTNGIERQDEGGTELYNLAAVRALQSGARVYHVEAERLPGGASGAAAIYRYAVDAQTTNLNA